MISDRMTILATALRVLQGEAIELRDLALAIHHSGKKNVAAEVLALKNATGSIDLARIKIRELQDKWREEEE